jgi:O-antigen ligase
VIIARYGAVLLLCGAALSFGYIANLNATKWVALYCAALACFLWFRPAAVRPVLAFCGYVLLSLAWSPDPLEGLLRLQNFAVLATVVVLFARTELNAGLFGATGIVGAFVLTLAFPDYLGGFGNENFRSDFVVICLPLTLCLGWWSLPFLVLGGGFLLVHGTLAVFAAAFCAAALVCVIAWRRGARYPALLLTAAAANFAVFADFAYQSWWHRLELYHNTLVLWFERPLFGHGVGAWDYVYPRVQEAHLWFSTRTLIDGPAVISGAAHSDVLQLLAEYGLIGFVLAFYVLSGVRWRTPAGLALASAIGVACVGFPLQTPAAALAGAVALGTSLRGARYWLPFAFRADTG